MTHLEATLKELKCLLTTDSGIAADLLVTANAERSDGKSGLGEHGGLASQTFQHLFQNMNAEYTWLQNTPERQQHGSNNCVKLCASSQIVQVAKGST